MKTGFISDLHIDINEDYPVIEILAELANENQLDLLVIAGDISETADRSIAAMQQLSEACACKVYYVPGNHDMWKKNTPDRHTDEIYAQFAADEKCLCGKCLILEGKEGLFALVGDIGWYDYSFADASFSKEEMDAMTYEGRTWQDHYFNEWTVDNQARMQIQTDLIEAQIEKAGGLPVVVVTHMLPVADFCVPYDQDKKWGFFNGFLGGSALEEMYKKHPVHVAVCGHVHYRKQVMVDKILQVCPCVGYFNEWPLYQLEDSTAERHIRDALQIMEL